MAKLDYRYTYDGMKKVNLATSKLIGDVADDLDIYQQGDKSQLWRSANGTYFRGMCLEHGPWQKITIMTDYQARAWIMEYYGAEKLVECGFEEAEEI